MEATTPAKLTSFQEVLVQTVKEAAASALERDAATLQVLSDAPGIRIDLRPRNREACPLVICAFEADSDGIDVFPGDSGAVYELWPRMTEKLPLLRRLVAAVVSGRYEERFKPGSDPPEIIATAHTDNGPKTMTRNVGFRRSREDWQHRQYAPY